MPQEGGNLKPFEKTTVNDQEGYWVRARVLAGSYNEPGKLNDEWLPLKTHAPLVSKLKVEYSGYTAPSIGPKPITFCRSRVDGIGRDHSPVFPFADAGQDRTVPAAGDQATVQLDASATYASDSSSITRYTWRRVSSDRAVKRAFAPFCAAEEGPALYLAFQQAFPAGKWIQLLLDVDEEKEPWQTDPTVFLFYEQYTDAEAVDYHRATPHYKELTEVLLPPLLDGPPEVEAYDGIAHLRR